MDEAIATGSAAGRFEPAIAVSSWSTAGRGLEYSSCHDASYASDHKPVREWLLRGD